VRLAVDRARRGEPDPGHAGRPHGFEHVERGDSVLLEIPARVFKAEAHVRVRSQVHHDVVTAHRVRETVAIRQQIAFDERERPMGLGLFEKSSAAGAEVVEHRNRVLVPEQTIGQVAPDEPAAPRDEVPHRCHRARAVPAQIRLVPIGKARRPSALNTRRSAAESHGFFVESPASATGYARRSSLL
jgi:hypothetical protein